MRTTLILTALLTATILLAGPTDGPDPVGMTQTDQLPPDRLFTFVLSPCEGPGISCTASCQSLVEGYPGAYVLFSLDLGDTCECTVGCTSRACPTQRRVS